jgi:hypothetical protein
MKRLSLLFLPLILCIAAAPAAAKDSQPQFKTIIVKHFVLASGVNRSETFADTFTNGLIEELQKMKYAAQVLADPAAVAPADAADSLLVEGKILSFQTGGFMVPGKVGVEFDIYRASDHAVVRQLTPTLYYKPTPANNDQNLGHWLGGQGAQVIRQALKNVALASIPAAPPQPAAAPAPVPAAAAAAPAPATATIQFLSQPDGAEITLDGNFAGSTPSRLTVKPGSHSIRIVKATFAPWERTIDTSPGDSLTITATLTPQ